MVAYRGHDGLGRAGAPRLTVACSKGVPTTFRYTKT